MNKAEFTKILIRIKTEFENCITTKIFDKKTYDNGNKAKEAFIRSQKLICYLHDYIKKQFINTGINPNKINPPYGQNSPEITLSGFLKTKNQDICILSDNIETIYGETIQDGPLKGTVDQITAKVMDTSISINIRSQLSSLAKNFDTLYERTFAEALNLHIRAPKMCLAEVYLIPTQEYNDETMKKNKVSFKKTTNLEKYILEFQAINNRSVISGEDYKYERVFLAMVDFQCNPPKLYSDVEELKKDGYINSNSTVSMDGLTINNFVNDVLDKYTQRNDIKLLK